MATITVDYLRQQRSAPTTAHLFSLLQQRPEPQSISVSNRQEVTQPKSFTFNRRADIALRSLTQEDKSLVRLSISRLMQSLRNALTSGQARRVDEQENLYVVKASDLRILFVLKGEEAEVEDIYRHERLLNLFS